METIILESNPSSDGPAPYPTVDLEKCLQPAIFLISYKQSALALKRQRSKNESRLACQG